MFRDDYPETPGHLRGALNDAEMIETSTDAMELMRFVRELDMPRFYGSSPVFESRSKIKPAADAGKWFRAMYFAFDFNQRLMQKMCALQERKYEIDEFLRGLARTFPAPYDQEMFEPAWIYQGKHILKSKHWAFNHVPKGAKAQYDKCMGLFRSLTPNLKTHDFGIGHFEGGECSYFCFRAEGCPGELEIKFPTPVHQAYVGRMHMDDEHEPFRMNIAWRFHRVIPVLDYFFGHTYYLDDIRESLESFVLGEEWRQHLHERFKTGEDENGNPIYTEEQPKYYVDLINEEVAKSYAPDKVRNDNKEDEVK